MLLCLIPFAFLGAFWGNLWIFLNLPLSLPFEILAGPLGYWPWILVTTIVAALMWGTLIYVMCALWLLLTRA